MSGAPPPDSDGYIEPPPEAKQAEPPSEAEAIERIEALSDDPDDILHAVMRAGGDDLYWYYIAISEHEYEGRDYLNERYVQLVKPGIPEREDSYKKNGINRRAGDLKRTASRLTAVYDHVAQQEHGFQIGELTPEDYEVAFVDLGGDDD